MHSHEPFSPKLLPPSYPNLHLPFTVISHSPFTPFSQHRSSTNLPLTLTSHFPRTLISRLLSPPPTSLSPCHILTSHFPHTLISRLLSPPPTSLSPCHILTSHLSPSLQTPTQQTGRIDYNAEPWRVSCGGGFGPVARDGYGVSYIFPGDNILYFHITSFKSSPVTVSKATTSSHPLVCSSP